MFFNQRIHMAQEIYDPYKPAIEFAKGQLDKAEDVEYLVKYWSAIGTLPNSSIPSVEKVDNWKDIL